MLSTQAVGIDLGTTYSCIAYLNEHGEPITLPNQEGELSTPSAVLFDDDEVIVGTEALRNAILKPKHVVQNSKRYIGNPNHRWVVEGKPYSPVDIATFILKKLISAAQEQIGTIEQAVITVPAQFSDAQRHATMEAGHRAGLQRVDIINEPVAAALCYVLGSEGLWFTELAEEQRIMVFDLGGGTFDLSLVRYQKNEVSVIVSSGDLNLGGIDWNRSLQEAICKQFKKEFRDDPRTDPASLQLLSLEVEQTKRSLSVRPRAALTCQHAGHRKTYQVELSQFERLTKKLVNQASEITKAMLKDNKMGWAHVDVVLTTGGASRMPMIRNRLKELSGRTLNTTLSPDLSIAHGATYYAGMLLSNDKFAQSILNREASERLAKVKQQSVNARALGILVRDPKTNSRVPHYLIAANTPLPTARIEEFGTVVPDQKRVNLQIVESGTSADAPPAKLGACIIEDLPAGLPEGSRIAVTIRYDSQARVHVEAEDVSSGKKATAEIIRQENLVPQLESQWKDEPDSQVAVLSNESALSGDTILSTTSKEDPADAVLLCHKCGALLDESGKCPDCVASEAASEPSPQSKTAAEKKTEGQPQKQSPHKAQKRKRMQSSTQSKPAPKPKANRHKKQLPKSASNDPHAAGEEEFWKIVE